MTNPRMKHPNIFLVGFMGAGKTTVGKILADKTSYKYLDADQVIEEESGATITQIFEEHGEPYFRDLESESLEKIAENKNQIIATGGGVIQRDRNWESMKKNGITIYLKASVETIWERIKDDTTRPLLQVEKPLQTVKDLLNKRAPMYEKADIIIITDDFTPEQIADEILELLN